MCQKLLDAAEPWEGFGLRCSVIFSALWNIPKLSTSLLAGLANKPTSTSPECLFPETDLGSSAFGFRVFANALLRH